MKLSKGFYEKLNSIKNFSELPYNDPQVIEIQKMRAYELNEEYKEVDVNKPDEHNHTAGSVYDETTLDNLTPARYLYLIQRGVSKKKLLAELGKRNQFIDRWTFENNLNKKHQQYYKLVKNKKVVGEYENLELTGKAISRSKDYILRHSLSGQPTDNGYVIKFSNRYEPTLEEALAVNEEETFAYWHSHRVFKQRAKYKNKYDEAVMA